MSASVAQPGALSTVAAYNVLPLFPLNLEFASALQSDLGTLSYCDTKSILKRHVNQSSEPTERFVSAMQGMGPGATSMAIELPKRSQYWQILYK